MQMTSDRVQEGTVKDMTVQSSSHGGTRALFLSVIVTITAVQSIKIQYESSEKM